MKKEMTGTQKELDGNVKEANSKASSGEQLIVKEEISGTPFHIVKGNGGYFVAMGRYRVSDEIKTLTLARKEANEINWNKLMTVVGIMLDNYQVIKDQHEKTKETNE